MSEELRVSRNRFFSPRSLTSSPAFLLLSFCVLLSATLSDAYADARRSQAVLQSVRHVSAADYTRITLTLSQEVRHEIFMTRADPDNALPTRLVIDFLQTQRGSDAPAALSIHDGLLKRLRTGQFSPTTTRVVLDIERIDNYKTFVLHDPYRVIVDVRGNVGQKSLPEAAKEKKQEPTLTIMLDPGHGGKDPGAIGAGRVSEKDVVLAISKRVGRKLTARLPVKVLYTRSSDVFIPLEERIAKANAAQADLFVSVHANASTNADLQGVETYYLNNTNDRATIRLASLENGLRPGGNSRNDSLSFLLSDLIQSGKEEDSIALANHLQESIVTRVRKQYSSVRNLGVKKGPFYVLVGAHMPCVLVETAFLTHAVEGRYVARPEYQEALAEGLFLGIARFLRTGRTEKSL
ncbi:MAG: N-acetylmuramoyl-L-alanine amidase [Candidatus Binatia bacterium]